jgi:hypothetical protein
MPLPALAQLEPFEICSIRPPTENDSLTFRLTRNCGWNKCLFCPVYKYGARFSRRSIEEVKKDVDRAKMIHTLMMEYNIGAGGSAQNSYQEATALIEKILAAKGDEKKDDSSPFTRDGLREEREEDEQQAWFSSWFKDKPTIEDSIFHLLSWQLRGGKTCFLGDSNSLILSLEFFAEAVAYLQQTFPTLTRFTIYGRTRSAAKKTIKELKAFRKAGLARVHFGLESGSDKVLGFMKKGVTAREHREGCLRTKEAGLSCCVYVMPGLGGATWSEEHAVETARVLTDIAPDYVRLRSLEVFPGTGLSQAVQEGDFPEASEEQVAREIRIMVEQIDAPCEMVSDSASNLLDVNGVLPHDRERMLAKIDEYLSLSPRAKLAFSLESRLRSFIGQYGGMTPELLRAVASYVTDQGIDISDAPDTEVIKAIRFIRSRLMP